MIVMVTTAIPVPPGPVAVMVSLTPAAVTFGVPEIKPVTGFRPKPAGNAGLTV